MPTGHTGSAVTTDTARHTTVDGSAELSADLAVVGGSLGGVAAALAACRQGRSVVLVERTDWLGGQLTSQAVPPDEHPWIERFGCTRSYRVLREGIRSYYRRLYPLNARARAWPALNPGAGRVSALCHEPRVALAVIEAMLAPHQADGRLTVLRGFTAQSADVDGDTVRSVTVTDAETLDAGSRRLVLRAPYVLDATDTGEVLPLAGCEYVTGAESQAEHGEPHAPPEAQPGNEQGFTVCFALSHHDGENHVGDPPEQYTFWRGYRPPFWPGPLLGMVAPDPPTGEPTPRWLEPNPPGDPVDWLADPARDHGDRELWGFRRLLARNLFASGAFPSDVTLVNWPMNDYWLGRLVDVDAATAARHVEAARQLSQSLLHWLQTEAPRPDGSTGWPGLRIRPDVTGTSDGLAKAPYVRESRRVLALRTVTEHDVAARTEGWRSRPADESVGLGSYRIDLHPSTGGDGYIDVASRPFEIPMGALVPVRLRNLLPACKNAGTTHVANGCLRLHPVEWNVGEVAGLLAAFCVRERREPHEVYASTSLREQFTALLDREGVERHWPDLPPEQRVAASPLT